MSFSEEFQQIIDSILIDMKKIETINEIRLFGSQVRQYNPKSDIDIYVNIKNRTEYDNIIECFARNSIKFKQLIHPIITDKCVNSHDQIFINNILNNSKILYTKNLSND